MAVPSCGGRLSGWPTSSGWTTERFDTAGDKTVSRTVADRRGPSRTVAGLREAMTTEPVHAHLSRVR
ncbi:MAG: hypothetical protein JWR63_4406 [Conexibacter sp.]|nr:hypothetical protein [Conexibacter sp.]